MSDRDSVTVAIVGAGEMGAAVGRRLHEAGAWFAIDPRAVAACLTLKG